MSRRPWTAEDQLVAESMRADGASYSAIGRALGRSRSLVAYHLDPATADKDCARMRARYERETEKVLAGNRRWAELNRDKVRKNRRKWAAANPQKAQAWRRLNIERSQDAARRWVATNSEKRKAICSRYRKLHKDRVLQASKRCSYKRRARRHLALAPVTHAAEDARFALWRHRCAFCGVGADHPRNSGYKRLTTDHVMALTRHGLDEADNIMPTCATCNKSKGNRHLEAWYRRQPFFTEARWRKICRHCPAAVVGQLPLAFSPPNAEPAP